MAKRKFKKLSNVDHVRLRTGMWLGQNSTSTFKQHFFEPQIVNSEGNLIQDSIYQISHEEIIDIPAKLKCFDEACMNCVDEYVKNQNDKNIPLAKKMSWIEVNLSEDNEEVTIKDNGRGIPAKNADQVFIHLMYGENFDDDNQSDYVAGQNGVGISLVRIVSSYFKVITTHEGETFRKLFTVSPKLLTSLKELNYSSTKIKNIIQYFDEHGNLNQCHTIDSEQKSMIMAILKETQMLNEVSRNKKQHAGTQITFRLNKKYFNDLDVSFNVRWMRQYLQDIAMNNPGLEVIFSYYQNERKEKKRFHFKNGIEDILKATQMDYYTISYKSNHKNLPLKSRNQISATIKTYVISGLGKSITWINSNFASLGGSPVEYLENRICDETRKKPIIVSFEKRMKTSSTRNDVRQCFHLYNNWYIQNPRFRSQDKSYLINDMNEFIREFVNLHLDKLIKKLDLINQIQNQIQRRTHLKALEEAEKSLKKANRYVIPKFISPTSKNKKDDFALFIAEGDSAISGLRPVRTPSIHGLFPLKGKPLNVKDMNLVKAMENEEIKNLISIIGLPIDKRDSNFNAIRYKKIVVITDADYDGYAIRSLIFSFFFEYWPELFEMGYIYYASAPLYEIDVDVSNNLMTSLKNGPDKIAKKKLEKKVFYCIDDDEYNKLLEKIKKNDWNLLRKKRNKGLGETSRGAMKYAIEKCLTQVRLDNIDIAKEMQKIWFHKAFAAKRREIISEYSQLFFEA